MYYLIKIVSITFFSSSGMQKFHHLFGCHTIGINSLLIFFQALYVHQVQYAKPKVSGSSSSKLSLRLILLGSLLKVPISLQEYDIARIFIKVEYIFVCVQSNINIFNPFTCNKPIGNKFQCRKRISKQLHHIFFELYIYQDKILLKRDLQEQLSPTFLEFYVD